MFSKHDDCDPANGSDDLSGPDSRRCWICGLPATEERPLRPMPHKEIEAPTFTLPLRIMLDWLLGESESKPADVLVLNELLHITCVQAGFKDARAAFVALCGGELVADDLAETIQQYLKDGEEAYLRDEDAKRNP